MDSFTWVRSSRSGGSGDNCIEVALNVPGVVAVRDSKDPDGAILRFTTQEWNELVGRIAAEN